MQFCCAHSKLKPWRTWRRHHQQFVLQNVLLPCCAGDHNCSTFCLWLELPVEWEEALQSDSYMQEVLGMAARVANWISRKASATWPGHLADISSADLTNAIVAECNQILTANFQCLVQSLPTGTIRVYPPKYFISEECCMSRLHAFGHNSVLMRCVYTVHVPNNMA